MSQNYVPHLPTGDELIETHEAFGRMLGMIAAHYITARNKNEELEKIYKAAFMEVMWQDYMNGKLELMKEQEDRMMIYRHLYKLERQP